MGVSMDRVHPLYYTKILLTISGVLNDWELRGWTLAAYRTFYSFSLVLLAVTSLLHTFEFKGENLPVLSLMSCFAMIHIIVKQANLMLRKDKLSEVLGLASGLYEEAEVEPTDGEILHVYTAKSNLITSVYIIILAAITSAKLTTYVLIDAYPNTPYQLLSDAMKTGYWSSMAYEIVMLAAAMIIVAREHNLLLMFTMQITGHLKIINCSLQSLSRTDSYPSAERRQRVIACIVKHTKLLRLVKEVNQLFSPVLFLETVLASTQCCLSGYSCAKMTMGSHDLPTGILMLIASLLLPFIICWCGSQIKEESSRILEASYGSGWEAVPPEFRKDIQIIMTVATKPMSLNMKNTFVMDLEKYSNILQASYSYFTMVCTMVDD